MRSLWFLCLAGCAVQAGGLPPTVHPTASVSQTSVGVAVGGMVTTDENDDNQEDNTQLVFPWGEGWARWGSAGGQLELHVLPGLGSVGYRFDLAPMGPGVGFALVPSLHAGLTYIWESPPDGDDQSSGLLLIGGALSGLVLIPSGPGFIWVAPRVGLTNGRLLGDQSEGADSQNLLTVGLAVGVDLSSPGPGIGVTLELAIQRSKNTDSDVPGVALWAFVPSLGLRL